jgi:hypothetical protein
MMLTPWPRLDGWERSTNPAQTLNACFLTMSHAGAIFSTNDCFMMMPLSIQRVGLGKLEAHLWLQSNSFAISCENHNSELFMQLSFSVFS